MTQIDWQRELVDIAIAVFRATIRSVELFEQDAAAINLGDKVDDERTTGVHKKPPGGWCC